MDASIRRAGAQDAEALAALGAETFAATYGHAYPEGGLRAFVAAVHTPERVRAALADPETAIWAVEREGRLIGYVQAASPPDLPLDVVGDSGGEVKRLYLLAEAQGAGLGSALLETAVGWLQERGRAPVWVGVWGHGHAAQKFYARHGFTPVGEYDWHEVDFADPSIVMRRG